MSRSNLPARGPRRVGKLTLACLLLMTSASQAQEPAADIWTRIRIARSSDSLSGDHALGEYSIELMRAVAKEAGLEVQMVDDPQPTMRRALAEKRVDVLVWVSTINSEWTGPIALTEPHTRLDDAIFLRAADAQQMQGEYDLHGRSVIVRRGLSAHRWLTENQITDDIVPANNMLHALQLLASGRGDCAVVPRLIGLMYMRSAELSSIIVLAQKIEAYTTLYHFGVRQEDTALRQMLDEALARVQASGTDAAIYKKWLGNAERLPVARPNPLRQAMWAIAALVVVLATVLLWLRALRRLVTARTRQLEAEVRQHCLTEQGLVESEARYRSLVDHAPDVILTVDHDATIQFINRTAKPLTVEKAIGTNLIDYIPVNHRDVVRRKLAEVFATGKPDGFEIPGIVGGASRSWYACRLGPIKQNRQVVAVTLIVTDITERKRAELQLRYRAEFETLITRLSTRFINLEPVHVDSAINLALGEIARFAGADRSYIFLFTEDRRVVVNTHEWCAEGLGSILSNRRQMRADLYPWATAHHLAGRTIHVPDVDMLPPQAGAEKRAWKQQSVQSLICVPLMIGRNVIGFVGFDAVRARRSWSDDVIALLRIVGDMFVSALERSRTDRKLREQNAIIQSILKSMGDGVIVADLNRRVVLGNPSAERILGQRVNGRDLRQLAVHINFIGPDGVGPIPASRLPLHAAVSGKPVDDHELYFRNPAVPDGRWISVNARPVTGSDGRIAGAVAVLHDITHIKKAEKKLLDYQRQLRSLASQASLAEQRERRRIASILHDHVGQLLAAAKIQLDAIRSDRDAIDVAARADHVRDLVEQAIRSTRSLTMQLSPPALYEFGLEPALESLAAAVQKEHNLRVRFIDDGQDKPLSDDMRTVLYQSVRELLANAVKHAHATRVDLSIERRPSAADSGANADGHVRIRVDDDGVGAGATTIAALISGRQGFGLFNVRERLMHMGARLDLVTRPGPGACMQIIAPLERPHRHRLRAEPVTMVGQSTGAPTDPLSRGAAS